MRSYSRINKIEKTILPAREWKVYYKYYDEVYEYQGRRYDDRETMLAENNLHEEKNICIQMYCNYSDERRSK